MASVDQVMTEWLDAQSNGMADVQDINILPPFCMVAHSGDDRLIEWLTRMCEGLREVNMNRHLTMLENIYFYEGIQHLDRAGLFDELAGGRGRYLGSHDIFVMNHARDLVNQKVSMLTRFKPSVSVMPWNSTYQDRIGAKFSKRAIDSRFHEQGVHQIARDIAFHAVVCGEGYARVKWDPHLGDISPQFAQEKLMAQQMGVPYEMPSYPHPSGDVLLDVVQRIGDVAIETIEPWTVLKQQAPKWKDVDYVFLLKRSHVQELQLRYPDIDLGAAHDFSKRMSHKAYGDMYLDGDYVLEVEFLHKRTPYLDQGFKACFVGTTLLNAGPLESTSGELPICRLTDYDDLKSPHGTSFIDDVRPPLVLHNKLINLMYRNVAIAGHPKLYVEEGSVTVQNYSAGPYVIPYKQGSQPPQMQTSQSIAGDIFTLADKFMQQIQQVAGVSGLSRGDSIPNARAAEILSIYQEQEEQRNGVLTDKYIAWTEKLARLTLECCSDNYKDEEQRLLRVFGKNNRYKMRQLMNSGYLKGPSNIVIERTTSLDDTRQGKINKIVQLQQLPMGKGGSLFTKEQISRMLDLADSESFMDLFTAAVDAAQAENEDMYEGIPIEIPQQWQNHLIHWPEHYLFMQSREFSDTDSVPDEVRIAFVEHLRVTEGYIYEQAKGNLALAQELALNPNFPAILVIGPNAMLPQFQLTMPQIIMMMQTPPMPPMPSEPAPPAPLPTE